MPVVKVFNDNVHPHTETFKGEKLTVPAKGSIEMEYEEAVQFAGQFTGLAPLGENGEPDERFFKMIRVEHPPAHLVYKDETLVCHANGRKAATAEELLAMLSEFKDRRVTDPEAEAAKKNEIEELRAQVAALSALVQGKDRAAKLKKEA